MRLSNIEKTLLSLTAIFILCTGYKSVNGQLVAGTGSVDYPKYSEVCLRVTEAGIGTPDYAFPASNLYTYYYDGGANLYDRISFVGSMPCDYKLNTSIVAYYTFMADGNDTRPFEFEYHLSSMTSTGVIAEDFTNEIVFSDATTSDTAYRVTAGTVSGGYSEPNVALYGEVGRDSGSVADTNTDDIAHISYCLKYQMDTAGCTAGQFTK